MSNEPATKAIAKKPDIAVEQSGVLRPKSMEEAIRFATMISASNLVPKEYQGHDKVGSIMVAMQMGAEIGMSPIAALQNIAVINGRPCVWGDALMAIALAHPDCEDIIENFNEGAWVATCTVKRRGKEPLVRTFSRQDAESAGLWGKGGPWRSYPKRMTQMRARGFAIRDAFADALRGLSSAEEQQDAVITMRAEPAPRKELGASSITARLKAEANTPDLVLANEEDDSED